MAVHYKISVRRVFVLANTSLKNRGVSQSWNMFLQISAQVFYRRRVHNPGACIRIKLRAVTVKGDFETAVLNVRQGVRQIRMSVMEPHRHARCAKIAATGGRAKKEHL